MEFLILPDQITIQLIDSDGVAVTVPGLLVGVTAFATYRNNYQFGPYASSDSGLICISRQDILNDVEAIHESGLMDYAGHETCQPQVEIRTLTSQEITDGIRLRREVWTELLKGEKERWGTIDRLIAIFEKAANRNFNAASFSAIWDNTQPEYHYELELSKSSA